MGGACNAVRNNEAGRWHCYRGHLAISISGTLDDIFVDAPFPLECYDDIFTIMICVFAFYLLSLLPILCRATALSGLSPVVVRIGCCCCFRVRAGRRR